MARLLPTLGLATCLALGAGSTARATVLVEVPLDDMIVDADAIVLGQVERVGTQMRVREDGTLEPWTVTTLRVESWLAGRPAGAADRVGIHERGGEWQGGGMRIAGTPDYRVGERVVVFLWRDPLGRLRTYGMVQGRYVVRAGVDVPTTVERDLHEVGFAQWSNGTMAVTHLDDVPITLDQLVGRIRDVLEMVR